MAALANPKRTVTYDEHGPASLSGRDDGYVTLDSGERLTFETGMVRDTNTNKPRYDLLIPVEGTSLLVRWAELLTRGAQKYDPRNWERASTLQEYDRFRESAFRHFMQWWLGDTDEDHAAAVVFNIQGAEYVKSRRTTG